MTLTQITGFALIASPFIGIAVMSTYLMGPLVTLGIFATCAALMTVIYVGCMMASS